MSENCIKIWHFRDAPEEYKRLSNHGGDEDWVLHCPAGMVGDYLPFRVSLVIEDEERSYLDDFGHVDRHVLDNGDVVIIFAHS